MLIRIAVDDKAELADLHHALAREPDLRYQAVVTATAEPDSSTLSAIDVINVVLTHAVAIASLVYSVAGNRKARREPSAITFIAGNGKRLTIEGGDAIDSQTVIAFLEANADEPDDGP